MREFFGIPYEICLMICPNNCFKLYMPLEMAIERAIESFWCYRSKDWNMNSFNSVFAKSAYIGVIEGLNPSVLKARWSREILAECSVSILSLKVNPKFLASQIAQLFRCVWSQTTTKYFYCAVFPPIFSKMQFFRFPQSLQVCHYLLKESCFLLSVVSATVRRGRGIFPLQHSHPTSEWARGWQSYHYHYFKCYCCRYC